MQGRSSANRIRSKTFPMGLRGRLWDERARLLEEIRQPADEVLGVADDAGERMRAPEETEPEGSAALGAVTELREELEAGEAPTVEVEVSRLEPEPDETGERPDSEPDDGPQAAGEQPGSEPDAGRTRA